MKSTLRNVLSIFRVNLESYHVYLLAYSPIMCSGSKVAQWLTSEAWLILTYGSHTYLDLIAAHWVTQRYWVKML